MFSVSDKRMSKFNSVLGKTLYKNIWNEYLNIHKKIYIPNKYSNTLKQLYSITVFGIPQKCSKYF